MRKGVSTEGDDISKNGAQPNPALALSRDEIRAFLTFGLAASLLLVYTFAWATSFSS
jgi:hypothetical protein